MKLNIKTKEVELTDELRSYVEEKIGELEKFISHPTENVEAWVEIDRNRHHRHGDVFEVRVDLHIPGKTIRSEAVNNDINTAVVEVKDELQREVKQYKEKTITKRRRGFRFWKKFKNLDE